MKPTLTDTPSRLSAEFVCANRDRDRRYSTASRFVTKGTMEFIAM